MCMVVQAWDGDTQQQGVWQGAASCSSLLRLPGTTKHEMSVATACYRSRTPTAPHDTQGASSTHGRAPPAATLLLPAPAAAAACHYQA
jgi:hypothetical protein